MRRVLWLFLAVSFLSLHSQEVEEVMPSEVSLNELAEDRNSVVAVNEFGDFRGGVTEFSPRPLTEEKDPLLSVTEPKKNGLYFLLPIGALNQFFLPGLSFRHNLNRDFLEVSYFNAKHGDVVLTRYKGLFEVESTEKLGVVYGNMFNASYGFKWNTRLVDPYLSFGAGLYLPYVRYDKGFSSVASLPTVSTALGLAFKYGFVDLALNYFPIKWTSVFEYQEAGQEHTFKQQMRFLANFRLGAGFPF